MNTNYNETLILKLFAILTLLISLIYIYGQSNLKTNIKHFQEDGLLVCYSTLIVSNENWKLNQDHLINNNSAGYVKIKNCKIK